MKTNTKYTAAVRGIVADARKYNNQIGNYEFHIFDENFNIAVKLNNGKLSIPQEIAQDYPKAVTPDDIIKIANTFKATENNKV